MKTAVEPFLREPAAHHAAHAGPRRRRSRAAASSCRRVEEVRRQGRLTREFGLTFRDDLSRTNVSWRHVLVDALRRRAAGWRRHRGLDRARDVREEARLGVGDVMTFDVAGQRDPRARDQRPQGRLGRLAERRVRLRAPSGAGRRAGAAQLRRLSSGARRSRGARRAAARSGHEPPERLGHQRARRDRVDPRASSPTSRWA